MSTIDEQLLADVRERNRRGTLRPTDVEDLLGVVGRLLEENVFLRAEVDELSEELLKHSAGTAKTS